MVGGLEFDRSEFNRAVQACRQPGSTYKPVYYSLALDKGYGYASLLNDIPRAEVDPITGEIWVPQNLYNKLHCYHWQGWLDRFLIRSGKTTVKERFQICWNLSLIS